MNGVPYSGRDCLRVLDCLISLQEATKGQVSPIMNRFETVVEILNSAVGGPAASVSFHGAFWRGISRDAFVAKKVFGLELITVGDGPSSNLIKALKGEAPFGADVGNDAADFNRMPSGLPAMPVADIAFIEKWITDGCLEDEIADVAPLVRVFAFYRRNELRKTLTRGSILWTVLKPQRRRSTKREKFVS